MRKLEPIHNLAPWTKLFIFEPKSVLGEEAYREYGVEARADLGRNWMIWDQRRSYE